MYLRRLKRPRKRRIRENRQLMAPIKRMINQASPNKLSPRKRKKRRRRNRNRMVLLINLRRRTSKKSMQRKRMRKRSGARK